MKDKNARADLRGLERRVSNLEEKVVAVYHCPKCNRRTAHEHIYVRELLDGTRVETSASFISCIGFHIVPGRRCLSCGAAFMITEMVEVQLYVPEPPKKK